MLFYTFASQEERRSVGGSAFLEMQLCRLPAGTKTETILAVESIKFWKNDSLYIKDIKTFYQEYGPVFDGGIYGDLKRGKIDIYGINYYPPELTALLRQKLARYRPTEHETVARWLKNAEKYNGFYILGI